MEWHERFRLMKTGLNLTNADIAEITGNTVDSIKIATQTSKDLPRMMKLAIVVYEKSKNDNDAKLLTQNFLEGDEKAVEDFIRKQLRLSSELTTSLRHVKQEDIEKEHFRFEMSGYEDSTGENTVYNQSILNKFAFLGIYDYTDYLSLDFNKGGVTLYYRYYGDLEHQETDLSGLGTVEIIYEIFKLTIFTDYRKRRRI